MSTFDLNCGCFAGNTSKDDNDFLSVSSIKEDSAILESCPTPEEKHETKKRVGEIAPVPWCSKSILGNVKDAHQCIDDSSIFDLDVLETEKLIAETVPATWYSKSNAAKVEDDHLSSRRQEYETELTDSRDSCDYRFTKEELRKRVFDPISDFREEIDDDCTVISDEEHHMGLEELVKTEIMKLQLTTTKPAECLVEKDEEIHEPALEMIIGKNSPLRQRTANDVVYEAFETEFGRTSPLKQRTVTKSAITAPPRLTSSSFFISPDVQPILEYDFQPLVNHRTKDSVTNSAVITRPPATRSTTISVPTDVNASLQNDLKMFMNRRGSDSTGARWTIRQAEIAMAREKFAASCREPSQEETRPDSSLPDTSFSLRSKAEVQMACERVMSTYALRKTKEIIVPHLPAVCNTESMREGRIRIFCKLDESEQYQDFVFNPDDTTFDRLIKDIATTLLGVQRSATDGYLFRKSNDGGSLEVDDLRTLEDEEYLVFIPAGMRPTAHNDAPETPVEVLTQERNISSSLSVPEAGEEAPEVLTLAPNADMREGAVDESHRSGTAQEEELSDKATVATAASVADTGKKGEEVVDKGHNPEDTAGLEDELLHAKATAAIAAAAATATADVLLKKRFRIRNDTIPKMIVTRDMDEAEIGTVLTMEDISTVPHQQHDDDDPSRAKSHKSPKSGSKSNGRRSKTGAKSKTSRKTRRTELPVQ